MSSVLIFSNKKHIQDRNY